jgi:hypothetical protein
MKKVLAVVLAAAFIGTFAYSADAQVRNIQTYFDPLFQTIQTDCKGPIAFQDTIWVVGNNFSLFLNGASYQVNYPPSMNWLGDQVFDPQTNVLIAGSSPVGIAISWPTKQIAFGPFLIQTATFTWLCDDCNDGIFPQSLVVDAYLANPTPLIIDDNNIEISVVGMTSIVCGAPIGTEESSWGKIKALYNE